MKYDFTSHLDRLGKDAIAVDSPANKTGGFTGFERKEGFDIIPMWVADMNFPVVPSIQEAIIERVNHPAFGYFSARDEYFDEIIRWQTERNGAEGLAKENIAYENGVLGGVISAMNVLASKGDNVLVQTPTYIGFTHVLKNNGYNIVHSRMYRDEQDIWRIDYEDMEKKIIENNIHVAIMCSPHNPCGRVWTRDELERCIAIFEKHEVWIISDEIWSDLTLEGYRHIPTQSVNEYARTHTVAFYAPSKTFNLAGLIGSYRIVYNKWLSDRLTKESSLSHYNSMNVLSMYALIGAYRQEGWDWLEELKTVLTKNVRWACEFVNTKLDGACVSEPQGTYMLFADVREYCEKNGITLDELLKRGWEYGVFWQSGELFNTPYAIRLNLALPFDRVQEAFDRLEKYVFI